MKCEAKIKTTTKIGNGNVYHYPPCNTEMELKARLGCNKTKEDGWHLSGNVVIYQCPSCKNIEIV